MLRFLASCLLCLVLLGCDAASNRGADGYDFQGREYTNHSFEVRVVEHESLLDLRRAAKALGIKVQPDRELAAFALLYGKKTCEVHIVEAENSYQPEWVGHEFSHCIYGRWHEVQHTSP